MRKVCRLAREVLDIAAAELKPGVTTDHIDEVVHKACIERNVSDQKKKKKKKKEKRKIRIFRSLLTVELVLSVTSELCLFSQIRVHFDQRDYLPRYPRPTSSQGR